MRSLCNKVETLNQFLTDTNIDIACLTETWLSPYGKQIILSQINSNYTYISTERQDRIGGGTIILINKNYSNKTEEIKITFDSLPNSLPKQEVELTIARAYPKQLPRGYSSCLIICAYIPVWSKSAQRNASYQLAKLIEPAINCCTIENKPLIILAGDLNGCPTDFICRSHQLNHLNAQPTRKSATLDIILSNAPKCYVSNTFPSFGNSDHLVVVSQPPLNLYKATRPAPRKIVHRSGKIAETVALIRCTDLETLVDSPYEIQNACNNFYHSLLSAQDICQPLKTTTLVNPKPWMTPFIQSRIKERQRLFLSGHYNE
jgi:exonuclease III